MVKVEGSDSASDDGFNTDRTGAEEEEGEEEDVDPAEVQRRKDRLEREQWLREQVCGLCRSGPDEQDRLVTVLIGSVSLSRNPGAGRIWTRMMVMMMKTAAS